MPLLNTADALRLGTRHADRAYVGAVRVWPSDWSPSSIPGLAAWFDAQQDAAAARFSEGQIVDTYTEWATGRVFDTQAPSGPKFHYGAGRPYFEQWNPDYGGWYSHDPWDPGPAGFTFVIACQVTGGAAPMLMTWGPDADGFELRHEGGNHLAAVMQYTSGFIYWAGSTQAVMGDDMRGGLRVAVGTSSIFTNGTKETGPGPPTIPSAGGWHLYVARRSGGYAMLGNVYEALAYAGPVSDADLAQLDSYLRAKWGL